MELRKLALSIVLGVSGCALQSQNGALEPSPGRALVIMRVIETPANDAFLLASFDPAQRRVSHDVIVGDPVLGIDKASDLGYIWKQINPGTYAFSTFDHQTYWGLCFSAQTFSFTVQPGQKVFLGSIDPAPFDGAVRANVLAHGDMVVRNQQGHDYFDGIPPFHLDINWPEANEPGSLNVSTTQSVTGVIPVVYTPATFKTGTTLFGQHVCGGYNQH